MTAGRMRTKWFIRTYLVLSMAALVLHAMNIVDLPRLITPPVALAILVALPLVPAIFEWTEVCRTCRSRSIELVPLEPSPAARPA
jgi:hypothetical protein